MERDESILDKLRGTGVGTEDPNIVGDAGPVDIPPGADPEGFIVEDDHPRLPSDRAEARKDRNRARRAPDA